MQLLEALARDAQALARGEMVPLSGAEAEVARQMQICNACRYCEGFCAVFPAMTRRLEFGKADVHFLANLCHNCGACLHACQYAPPHDFAVNVPQAMATVRGQTYADYAWPPALGRLYQRNGLTVALALAGALALFLALRGRIERAAVGRGRGRQLLCCVPAQPAGGPVRAGVPLRGAGPVHGRAPLLARPAARDQRCAAERTGHGRGHRRGAAASNTWTAGHGEGCHDADDAYTLTRRRCHHLTFYGFLLCFAATSVATLYHYVFGWVAPYDLAQPAQAAGRGGGVAMVVGTAGLWRLNLRRHPLQRRPGAKADGPGLHRAAVRDQREPVWRCGGRAARRPWP